MFRTFAAAALLVTTTALSSTSAYAAEKPETTPAQRVNALVSPSIVYLETVWTARIGDEYDDSWVGGKGKPFTLVNRCTGFVLTEDGYLGTAAHCLNAKDDAVGINMREAMIAKGVAYAKSTWCSKCSDLAIQSYADRYFSLYPVTSDGNPKDRIRYPVRTVKAYWGANVSGIETDEARPAKVMESQTFNNGDTALLKVNEDNMNALPVYGGDDLTTGTNIATVGFPGAIEESGAADADYTPSIKTGSISAQKERSGGLTDVYEVDADVHPGMSGGPTVTQEGEIVGVNSFSPGSEPSIDFVQPVENLKELTNSEGVNLKLGKTTQEYRKGLDAYFAGDRAVAVKNLQAVVDEQPANGLAKEYLEKAKDLPIPPKQSNLPLILGIVGGLLLLALLGGLAFLLLRRRSGPTPMPQAPAFAPTPGGEAGAPAPGGQMAGTPAGSPMDSGYPTPQQTQPVAKVPTPRSPDEVGAPSGQPVEPAEVRSSAPAGFAPTSKGTAGQSPQRSTTPSTSQPGVSTGPAITSATQPGTAGAHHFCTECGAQVTAGGKFCGECGHPV